MPTKTRRTSATRRGTGGKKKASGRSRGSLVDRYRKNLDNRSEGRQKAMDKRANSRGGDFDSMFKDTAKLYRFKDGDNRIRILPALDQDHWGVEIWVHYNVGPDEQSYLCLEKHKQEPDPIVEEMLALKSEGLDKDELNKMKAKQRLLLWVIDRNNPEEGPMLCSMPWTVDRDIINLCHDPDTGEYEVIEDPLEGYDVIIKRAGQGQRTQYTVQLPRRTSALSTDDDEMEEWLAFAEENPLEDQLVFYDYDHIAKVFGGASVGNADEDPDEDGEEEEEVPRSSRRRSRAQQDEDPEEEGEEGDYEEEEEGSDLDAPEEEEEEEPEPPKTQRRGRKKTTSRRTTGRRRRA